ncbi:hypothetical protein OHB12_04590 [Nocardia sp. NBC_01730]|uniref:hypothetical protein n=1 Tax=Nocardia sp. NBC_01730 TaxID=2975998 RepID=UPI002E0DC095|nr:hypothetical protein OHB12_04590 [Nocardia sp. NBC_01730]
MLPSIPDLATIYAHELHVLSELLGVKATIINTGGGCTAIEVAVADAPGSEPVTMEITTADGGLAATGEDIVHWYAVIRTVESGVAQADGHNLYSFEAAYLSALENLRNRVVPSEGRCPCMLVPGHDYVLFNEDHLRQARTSCRSMLSAPADSVDADAVDGAPPGENLTLDCRGMIVHRSELGTIQFVRRSPTQIMAYDADTNQRIALWDGEELTGPIIATALADVVLDRVSVR